MEALRRLVALAGELPGWSLEPGSPSQWWATGPLAEVPARGRVAVIGWTSDEDDLSGTVEPTAIASDRGPAEDQWTLRVLIQDTASADPLEAMAGVEEAVNDLREMLAGNHRLHRTGWDLLGVHDVRVIDWRGPFFGQGGGSDPFAQAFATISLTADLRR